MTQFELIKILTKWSIDNKEYELLYNLYFLFNLGIPNIYIYKFPKYSYFSSLNSLQNKNENLKIDNEHLQKLIDLFKKSKYKKLSNWDNRYGYYLE